MHVGRIGPADAVADLLDVAVGEDGDVLLHAHRAGEAHRRPGHFQNCGRIGQFDLGGPGDAADFSLVGIVVAAHQHGDRFSVGQIDERLDELLRLAAEEFAHLLDGACAGRGHFFQRLGGNVGRQQVAAADLRPLLVGRIAAVGAVQHDVLAVFGRDHEFVTHVAADRSALGLDGQVVQTAAIEDAAVGGIHLLVALVELLQRGVEAVGVLHEEFAGAQHAEPRPLLVAKFGLNLVQHQRHLPIAGEVAGDQVGDYLFVGRAQGHLHLAVLPPHGKLDQYVAEGLRTAGLLPKAQWGQGGHVQFHGPGGVHLLPHDPLGLPQRPQAQGQIDVCPGHHLRHQSGAEHEDVAGDFRPFGRFLHRGNKRLGPEHGEEGLGIGD